MDMTGNIVAFKFPQKVEAHFTNLVDDRPWYEFHCHPINRLDFQHRFEKDIPTTQRNPFITPTSNLFFDFG
jgi:hypothetical protein